jgi:serine/threonine-protein kinase
MSSDPATGPRQVVRIGRFEILSHIANGGMGAVYRARDTENNRDVALKVLHPELANNAAILERFRREARHAAKLRHDHIVTIFEFEKVPGSDTYYLAMEYVDGIDLHEYIKRKGPLPPPEALTLLMQACRALRHAHAQNIVHRDVKPSNLLVTRKEGRLFVKLTDMGLAREADNEEFRVTRIGTTVGTLDYMSPEQARNSGSADIRSDLYSLGSTWFHLLTGQAPFAGGGLGERLLKIMNDEPPDPRQFNPKVTEGTATVLLRLLAKDPAERYQTPNELLNDLKALQSGRRPIRAEPPPAKSEQPVVPSRRIKKKPRKTTTPVRKSRRTRPAEDTDIQTAHALETHSPRPGLWYLLGASAVLLALAGGILFFVWRHRAASNEEVVEQPPVIISAPVTRSEAHPLDQGTKPVPITVGPVEQKPRWPTLYQPSTPIHVAALRKEIEAPWASSELTTQQPAVLHVGRAPVEGRVPYFSTLAAACAAATPKRVSVIEIDDNGPFFDVPSAVADKSVILRPGKGYRPLLVWDVPRTLAERQQAKAKGKPPLGPLVFLDVQGGSLTLEGIELAFGWPDAVSERATVLQVQGGDLTLSDCTFSMAGTHRDGVTLARFLGGGPTSRCRVNHCYTRGASLTALEIDASGADVLLDGCLLVGGAPPLLGVRTDGERGVTLNVARSTLICAQTLLMVQPAQATVRNPIVKWLGWDALLSRSSAGAGGNMVAVGDQASTHGMTWRAINCLYAGWQNLLTGATPISGSDATLWRRHWTRIEGDDIAREPWPPAAFNNPSEVAAATYRTADTPVGFAALSTADQPLGCPLETLPATRDNWLSLTCEPFVIPRVEPLTDGNPPPIPNPGDSLYHGERLDLTQVDLGAYLQRLQKSSALGPRLVFHLTGTGERQTTPIRIKGHSLVLYFEPVGEDRTPLALTTTSRSEEALIEVEGGNLDILGGELHVPTSRSARVPPHLIKVRGGDLRLFHCRLDAPPPVPDSFAALISLEGSGDPTSDKARNYALSECVLVSGRAGVRLDGVGNRLLMQQSLVVAGSHAFIFAPGSGCKDRANLQCVLERTTIAAQQAVVRLGDARQATLLREPALFQTRECAFLNPFVIRYRLSPAGLLHYDGDALTRGLLVWQSESDVFDRRLHFGASSAQAPPPDKPEPNAGCTRLWGMPGVRRPVLDLALNRTLDSTKWALDRLTLPPGRGADLTLLGVTKKNPKPMP